MATYEYNGLMTVKDAAGNKYLLYPITKAECVDGLEEALAAKAAAAGSAATSGMASGTSPMEPEKRQTRMAGFSGSPSI